MFRNKYKDEHQHFYIEAGTDIVPVFVLSDDETYVIEVGKKSLRDEINAFKDSTDINVIQKQLMVGNETVTEAFKSGGFKAPENAFADSSLFPQTMAEYQKAMRKAIGTYNSIPEEIRNQFDSPYDFANASDDKLQTVFDNYNAKLQSKDNSVVENEKVGE